MTTPKSPTSLVRSHPALANGIHDLRFFFALLGGNSLDKAPAGRVHDFVKVNGGHTVITKVSIQRYHVVIFSY